MKDIANLIKLTVIFTLILTLFSCSNDNNVEKINNSIINVIGRNSQYTSLSKALDKAGLKQILDQNGPYTLFAPTNDAFEIFLNDNGFSSIDEIPVTTLEKILLNHIIKTTYTANNLPSGYLNTLSKGFASDTQYMSIFFYTSNEIIINGHAKITLSDIVASNGIIHQIDKVLDLPTVLDHLKANPSFSSFYSAITSNDNNGNGYGDQTNVASLFNFNSNFLTVFSPNNDAFSTAFTGSGFAVSASTDQISTILKYHLTNGNSIFSSFTNGQTIETLTNPIQNTIIDLSNTNLPMLSDQSTNQATFIGIDIQSANGILHAIDKVLEPNL